MEYYVSSNLKMSIKKKKYNLQTENAESQLYNLMSYYKMNIYVLLAHRLTNRIWSAPHKTQMCPFIGTPLTSGFNNSSNF